MAILGGSGVVISGVISLLIWVIIIVTLLITLLITTHEPPSGAFAFALNYSRPLEALIVLPRGVKAALQSCHITL